MTSTHRHGPVTRSTGKHFESIQMSLNLRLECSELSSVSMHAIWDARRCSAAARKARLSKGTIHARSKIGQNPLLNISKYTRHYIHSTNDKLTINIIWCLNRANVSPRWILRKKSNPRRAAYIIKIVKVRFVNYHCTKWSLDPALPPCVWNLPQFVAVCYTNNHRKVLKFPEVNTLIITQ